MAYQYTPHPRTREHLEHKAKPVKVDDQHGDGFNARLGLLITKRVGTMACAYVFALIAFVSFPTVLKQAGFGIGFDFGNGTVILVAWIAQTFLQLVLLSIIMVGQDVQSLAADKRSENTYKDAEAVLHEAIEIQKHLAEQDKQLADLVAAKH